jgi:hypothetical protein
MWNKKIILLILSLVVSLRSFSQCAMCKAAVEADLESGGTKGAGLNEGILYLMATPYLAMLFFGISYTLQKRKKNQPA